MKLIAASIIAALALAGCGASASPSPEDQVRDAARKGTEAIVSNHPERACQYMVDRDACVGAAVMVKGMDVAAMVGIPENWESMLNRATVKISGDRAVLEGFDINHDGKPGVYVKKDGKWLSDNR